MFLLKYWLYYQCSFWELFSLLLQCCVLYIDILQDIHELVIYSPDKTLVGKIDVKYERFVEYLQNWDTIDVDTKLSFANEILIGDGSVDNAIRRFHNSVYARGGYFEE